MWLLKVFSTFFLGPQLLLGDGETVDDARGVIAAVELLTAQGFEFAPDVLVVTMPLRLSDCGCDRA